MIQCSLAHGQFQICADISLGSNKIFSHSLGYLLVSYIFVFSGGGETEKRASGENHEGESEENWRTAEEDGKFDSSRDKIRPQSFVLIQAEERLKMIEEQMKIEEEKLKFKRREEKKVKNEQKKILGKDNSRPKLSFAITASTN